jgi:predicted nuclease with TOPRIM domain
MDENIIILDNKIHFYEQLYKAWCKKIDSNMKHIFKKINELDKRVEKLENNYKDQIKIIKYNNSKLEDKFDKHKLKLKKNNEIIVLLYKKINQKSYIEQIKIKIYNHFQNNVLFHKILFYIRKIDSRISMFILFIFFIIYIIYK